MPSRRSTWTRFVAVTKPYFQPETRWRAIGLVVLLIGLILGLAELNIKNCEVVGDWTTALTKFQTHQFARLTFGFLGLMAAMTAVAAFKKFAEDRVALRWRERLTEHLLDRYLAKHAYYRLNGRADIDNPDQRIAEDVKTFTTTALAFLIIGVNSTANLVGFSGVLWAISPWLFLAAVLYSGFGTLTTILLGRRLVAFDISQLRKEGDFRYDLIQLRTHAEPIALQRGEDNARQRLRGLLGAVVGNQKRIIRLNRSIMLFTEYYKYLIPVLPTLVVAPLFLHKQVEFGVIAEAGIAFGFVVNAFSVIVEEFQTISTFGAVIERLGAAWGAIEEAEPDAKSMIEIADDPDQVAYDGLTLVTPRDGRLLVKDLSIQVPRGLRLLITGPHGSGRTALLRATAGLWTSGQGRITRPPFEQTMFLPQHPYLAPGTLRELLLGPAGKGEFAEARMLVALEKVGFEAVLERAGGWDVEQHWSKLLSVGEQQLLAFARLLLANPEFAFLDEATSGLDPRQGQHLYEVLSETALTYISVGTDNALAEHHDMVLELLGNGAWVAVPCTPAVYVEPGPEKRWLPSLSLELPVQFSRLGRIAAMNADMLRASQ